ncbi:YbaN family protein [Propylenella binzhouense]|uniref:DUF454 domain-containing protein n=1 Tax=Propylenella binzhouense TaxID=2555902 RepID=A0A964T520_9HYPH|nr:YbaN family protein [Propylenella binzhouense]MYZ48295.1 DUF454 domain-containing protein [Propylenella binzhouense]
MKKPFLVALGLVSTGLGILGVWLPGLPTTPFVLLALWAFARSSPRLHAWLGRIPLLSAAVAEADRFERERSLRMGVKLTALSMAWGSFLLVLLVSGGSHPLVLGAVGAAAIACSVFLWWVPTAGRPG